MKKRSKALPTLSALVLGTGLIAALVWYYDVYVNWQPRVYPFVITALVIGVILLTLLVLWLRGEYKVLRLVWKSALSMAIFALVLSVPSYLINNVMKLGAKRAADVTILLAASQLAVLFFILLLALRKQTGRLAVSLTVIGLALIWPLSFIVKAQTCTCADDPYSAVPPVHIESQVSQPGEAGSGIERWRMHQISFNSEANYADPFNDVILDITFTGPGGAEMVMPAFWDGGGTWRVRFAPVELGEWNYITSCSNTEDAGLHNQSGSFTCVPYTGELEIYRRGFLKTEPGVRYLMYADGTPFFYLGDTHWSMPKEPFDAMFKTVVDARAAQGFTVYQSEPLGHPVNHGPGYDLRDGLDESDLAAFADLDRRFDYIAEAGLAHANAQLFFAVELAEHVYEETYLRQLGRYWAARYGAYPVLWTTAQEADDDFYGVFTAEENPWKIVAEALAANDPYCHPLSAHQENTGHTSAGNSAFHKLEAHSWFAAQWSPALDSPPDFAVPKDYRQNGGGKPAVNYEGRYENLWTKNFGARAQGWLAFLNGMAGYGYGAIDIWLYESTYDADTTSRDGIDTITPEDKAAPWTESLYFETTEQLGYMRRFFEKIAWWELTPRFDCRRHWFVPWPRVNYSVASQGNESYVAYFYNRTKATGLLRGLDRQAGYQAEWFNPRSGETLPIGEARASLGIYRIPRKPDTNDWVLYVFKGDAQ